MPAAEKIAAKAEAAAEKARAKASRPWYKKKRFLIPLAIMALAVVAVASGGGEKTTDISGTSKPATQAAAAEQRLYSKCPDYNKGDVEKALGEPGEVSGCEVTVTQAGYRPKLNEFMAEGYLVADVAMVNNADKAQPYNPFHWKLVTPNGQIIDPTFGGGDNDLQAGDLTTGGRVNGKIVWEVGAQKGDYYIIYDPPSFSPSRVVRKVTV